ncbi:CAT RNA binding domain-containing protein [Enterococcus faecium]|uniref:CAT RNA binding domain-containing protein n=2 Tax=Enterococcus TaxID=1350 RepID=UPI001E307382|nr:CAT RNA binding domain-containing protein [Enterococcus faecium]
MQVVAVLNHNAIIAKSNEGEWVLIKKGIGFKRKIGDLIHEREVESVYQKIQNLGSHCSTGLTHFAEAECVKPVFLKGGNITGIDSSHL